MYLKDIYWWLIVFFNTISYFTFRFGVISKGRSNVIVEFVGGTLILASFILMFIFYGLKAMLILIPIFWFFSTPIVEIIISKLKKKLYPENIKYEISEEKFYP